MWHVYYDADKKMYQLEQNPEVSIMVSGIRIAVFKSFDMAYQYVTRMNGTNDVQAYSKWTARAR